MSDRRLLLVHAHPDDETLTTGATMARYVAEGAQVTLVTCTAGEMGEILVPELEHLAADREDGLGEHRRGELEAAMAALGVTDHRFLGGFGHFRDSGMQWDETGHATAADDVPANAFWHADLTEAADLLVEVVREVRPHVVVTYDEFGNYGHPDHVQAHRVATYAVALAAVPSYRLDLGEPWDAPKLYWTTMSASALRAGIIAVRDAGQEHDFMSGFDPDALPRFATPDEHLSAVVDGSAQLEAKLAAMRAYPTQIEVDGPFFSLSNGIGQQIMTHEYYRLAKGVAAPAPGQALEDDLFAGL